MFQISKFFQISEASEEGSLEPNHELSKSDQDNINQKDNDEIDNIENSKEDLKTDDKDLDSDDDYVEMNQINPSREISSNTITNDNNETTKEESNEGVKEDEKTKDATTTTSKDISIQTDPNALSPNKYRYHFKKIYFLVLEIKTAHQCSIFLLINNFIFVGYCSYLGLQEGLQ